MNIQPTDVTLAVVNDYPLVVAGTAHLLDQYPAIKVLEHASRDRPRTPVDVALFDAFASGARLAPQLHELLEDPHYARVAVYSWNLEASRVRDVLDIGVHGYLGKTLSGEELAVALVRIKAGEKVISPEADTEEIFIEEWPGRASGLSPREAEVIALITQGFTNEDIAQTCFLSINSVKSYIRSAYRKMGVERRSQAVLWGVQNGFQPVG